MGEPPLVVGLAWFEVEAAKSVAKLRRDEKHRLGLRDKYGYAAGDPWDCEVNSAAAEIATAKAANLYWSGGVNTFKGADVGTKIQVRWSDRDYRTQKTSLIVRPEDPDDHFYVLVTGRCDLFYLHGSMLGSTAKDPQWWSAPNGRPACWMVPRQALAHFAADWVERASLSLKKHHESPTLSPVL
jgi:hypothetical protein